MLRPLVLAAALACLHAGAASAAGLRVAVAGNFAAPMQELAAQFERETGHKVSLAFGATGKFYAQIVNGAPFEVLLAADDETPARLIDEGHARRGAFTYAIGRLVLWSATPGLIDGEAALGKRELVHLAIANPRTAPYGRAAVEALTALGRYDSVKSKFVFGENVVQAHQFAASGNAQAGLIAYSQVFRDGQLKSGSAWVVPARLHQPIAQDAVLLGKGKPGVAALALLAYLKSDGARRTIRRYGYDLPQ